MEGAHRSHLPRLAEHSRPSEPGVCYDYWGCTTGGSRFSHSSDIAQEISVSAVSLLHMFHRILVGDRSTHDHVPLCSRSVLCPLQSTNHANLEFQTHSSLVHHSLPSRLRHRVCRLHRDCLYTTCVNQLHCHEPHYIPPYSCTPHCVKDLSVNRSATLHMGNCHSN